eukprot:CAMPEP_0119144746 /NCGR_PEP_ID=MMETSP1310-20130426/36394_1 /TAXON_ID=464262 /ORGANISM="Genus nov. species nov., Strain RCC2339" /LENGTH=58 /DNA_ID=CAMNT_0007136519 /DNA_START=169 /DNA_END=342 /DNA_ORIENTATION=+
MEEPLPHPLDDVNAVLGRASLKYLGNVREEAQKLLQVEETALPLGGVTILNKKEIFRM